MVHTVINASADVLISSVDAIHGSVLIFRGFARDHGNLVRSAQHHFGKDFPDSDFEVHFYQNLKHDKSDRCDAKIDPHLYNMGVYFSEEYLQRGILCLTAHFVARNPTPMQKREADVN